MQIDLTALPDDSAALQSMVRDALTATRQRDRRVSELTAEVEKLQAMVQKLLRHRFGHRSEQLSPDQLALAIEDLEQEIAEQGAAKDAAEQSGEQPRRRRAARPLRNLGALPADLPRDEARADVLEHVEGFYNRRRLHSAIGYMTPEQKAELAAAASAVMASEKAGQARSRSSGQDRRS